MSEPSCESCGRKWIDHDGIIRTCKRSQDQAEEITRLKQLIRDLLDDQAKETKRLEQLLREVVGSGTSYENKKYAEMQIPLELIEEIKEAIK